MILGLIHIVTGLAFSNGYYLPYSMIVNRILDIPFAIIAVIYGFSTIYLELEENTHKTAKIIFIIFTLLIFSTLIYINFLVSDKIITNKITNVQS